MTHDTRDTILAWLFAIVVGGGLLAILLTIAFSTGGME